MENNSRNLGFRIQHPPIPLSYFTPFHTTPRVIQQLPRIRHPAGTWDNLTVSDLPPEDQLRLSTLYSQNRYNRALVSSNDLEKQLSALPQEQPIQLTVDQQKIFKQLNQAPIDPDDYEQVVNGPYTSLEKLYFFQSEQQNKLQLSKNLDKWFKESPSF